MDVGIGLPNACRSGRSDEWADGPTARLLSLARSIASSTTRGAALAAAAVTERIGLCTRSCSVRCARTGRAGEAGAQRPRPLRRPPHPRIGLGGATTTTSQRLRQGRGKRLDEMLASDRTVDERGARRDGHRRCAERPSPVPPAWRGLDRRGSPPTVGRAAEKMRPGRIGRGSRADGLAYFALGDRPRRTPTYLTDYYAWLGDEVAGYIAGSAAKDAETCASTSPPSPTPAAAS